MTYQRRSINPDNSPHLQKSTTGISSAFILLQFFIKGTFVPPFIVETTAVFFPAISNFLYQIQWFANLSVRMAYNLS